MGGLGKKTRGVHEQGVSFQFNRLLTDLERVSSDPRTILEAWMENVGAFEAAAVRQEKVRSGQKQVIAQAMRQFAGELESAVYGLLDDDLEERLLNLAQLRRKVPIFHEATAQIPFEGEPQIRVRFQEESEPEQNP